MPTNLSDARATEANTRETINASFVSMGLEGVKFSVSTDSKNLTRVRIRGTLPLLVKAVEDVAQTGS